MSSTPIKYVPFISTPSASFWHSLLIHKLNVLKLDDSPLPITGFFHAGSPSPHVFYDENSHSFNTSSSSSSLPPPPTPNPTSNEKNYLKGTLKLFNTMEEFKLLNKQTYLNRFGPSNDVICVAFADLKEHKIWFWFAYPGVKYGTPTTSTTSTIDNHNNIDFKALDATLHSARLEQFSSNPTSPMFTFFSFDAESNTSTPFYNRTTVQNETSNNPEIILGVVDSVDHEASAPGWPLRMLIDVVQRAAPGRKVTIIVYKTSRLRRLESKDLENPPDSSGCSGAVFHSVTLPAVQQQGEARTIVGWETPLNSAKAHPQMVNLSSIMSPEVLSSSAVDLNIKVSE